MKQLSITILIFCTATALLIFSGGCTVKESKLDGPVTLRSELKQLSDEEISPMLKRYGFHEQGRNKYRDFPNKFEFKEVGAHMIVIDHVTGLAWFQSGSSTKMSFPEAEDWVKQWNLASYAGIRNWRLPTVEEAASLLESKRTKNRYINPLFSSLQTSIRTCDYLHKLRGWSVSFHAGKIFKVGITEPDYVRPVATYLAK